MAKHTWTNRTAPPLVVAMVIGCVWYALENRPPTPVVDTTPKASASLSSSDTATASAQVLASSPTVTKLGTQVQFSVNPAQYKHIQKVEFYVEKQFVGTAYSQPYSVAVSENNLTAGAHTVVAKIYTMDSTAQSQPATFTAQPAAPPAPANDASDAQGAAIVTNPSLPPASTPAPLAAPNDVMASSGDDGTTVTLNWVGSDGATSYQVLRGGSVVATTIGTGYTDTGLTLGYTYDYQIVALSSGGVASDPSAMVAVTTATATPAQPDSTQDFVPNGQSSTVPDGTVQ